MEQALRAIANDRRRAMLALAWDGERTATEIADLVGLSKPAASQHLRVLREAGLVHVRAAGNRRLYRADPARMAELRAALESFWGERLARMRDEVEPSEAVTSAERSGDERAAGGRREGE